MNNRVNKPLMPLRRRVKMNHVRLPKKKSIKKSNSEKPLRPVAEILAAGFFYDAAE